MATDYLRWGCVTQDLNELLGQHQEMVDRFLANGRTVVAHDELFELPPCIAKHTRRCLRRDRKTPAMTLQASLFCLLLFPLLLYGQGGIPSWMVPMSFVAGGLTKALFEAWMRRQILHNRRRQVARPRKDAAGRMVMDGADDDA